MTGVNRVILVGHLGRDPEVRRTQDGRPVATFSLATSESWRDKTTGERREATEWHQVVIFNEGLAKVAEQYLKKGSKVYIEGANRTRKWTDGKGVERYTTEVVLGAFNVALQMLDRVDRAPPPEEAAYGQAGAAAAPGTAGRPDYNDEIPF